MITDLGSKENNSMFRQASLYELASEVLSRSPHITSFDCELVNLLGLVYWEVDSDGFLPYPTQKYIELLDWFDPFPFRFTYSSGQEVLTPFYANYIHYFKTDLLGYYTGHMRPYFIKSSQRDFPGRFYFPMIAIWHRDNDGNIIVTDAPISTR